MMRLNNFFIGDPDKYERLISALQFCAEYNPEKLNLKHMSSYLEKGMFYRGMLNFPSTSLNLELQSLLEKFTEFDQRIMLTESMIYIKQSGSYQLRQRLEYFVHEMQSNIQVLSRNDIYFIIRIREELIILIPDDMNQIAMLHISNDIEYYDKEGDKQLLYIFNKTMETIMLQYRYTQSTTTTTATTNSSISGNNPRSSMNNTSTSIKDNPYSIEIACILNVCRDEDNDTKVDQDNSYIHIQAKYDQLSTWIYNHAKQEKVATIQSLRKQLDFLHIQKYEINMSLNDTIFTKLFLQSSHITTTKSTLTNTTITAPSSSSYTNSSNSNTLDSTGTNDPAVLEDIALTRDSGQSNVHISDVNKSTSRLDELLAMTIQQSDTNESMKVKIKPQLWIHTDDDNINNIEMHPNSANSGTSQPISSTTPSIRPSTASRPPTAPSSSSSSSNNNQNKSAINTATNNSNSHDDNITNHSFQNRQLSTSPVLNTSSSSSKSQHLLTLVKNKSPKLRGSHNSTSSTSALLTPSSPSSSGLFTYSSSSSNLCTSRSIPSYPNNNNNNIINDNITKEIIEHHPYDVSDKHADCIHETTDNPLDPLQSTSEFIMNPHSDNTTNHQDPVAYQNTHLDINTTTTNHHETENSTHIPITSLCHSPTKSPTIMSPRTPMTPTTPSMKHKSYTNLFDQITSSPSLLTTLSMPLISPSMKNKSLIFDKSFSNKESLNIYINNPTTYETNTSEDNVNIVDVDTMTSYTTNDDNHIPSNDAKDDHIQRLVVNTKEDKLSTDEVSNSYIYTSDASITNHDKASNIDIDIDTYIDDALIYKHDKKRIDSSNIKIDSSSTALKPDTIIESNHTEIKSDEVSSYIQLAYQAIKDMVFSETIFTPSSTLNSTFDPSQLQLTATLPSLQDDEEEDEKDEMNEKEININDKEYNSDINNVTNLRSIHEDDKSSLIKAQEVNSSNTTLNEEKNKSSNANDIDKSQLLMNNNTTTVSYSNHNNRDNTDDTSKEFFTNMNEPHDQIGDKSKDTDISINSSNIQSNIIPTQLNISASHPHIHTKNLISSDPTTTTTSTQSNIRPSTGGGITKYLYPMNQYIIPSLDTNTLEDTAATATTITNTDHDDNDINDNNTYIDLIKTCDPDVDVDASLFHLEKITPILKEALDQDTTMLEFHNLLAADIISDKSPGTVEDNGNINIPILTNAITSNHVTINTLENDKIDDIADVSFPMNSVQESILVPPSQLKNPNKEVIPTNVVRDDQRSIGTNDKVLVRPMTAQQYTSTPILTTTSTIPVYRKSMSSFDHRANYDDVQHTSLSLDEEIINSSYFRSSIGSYKQSKLSKDKLDYDVHVYENMNHNNSSSLILNDIQDEAKHDMDDHMSEDEEMSGLIQGEKGDIWSHEHTPSLSLSVSSPKLSQLSPRNTDTSPLNKLTLSASASGQRASTIKLPITPTRSFMSKNNNINADQLSTSTSLFTDHMKTPISLSASNRSFSTPILPHSASAKFLLPPPRTIVNGNEERVKDIRLSLSHQDIESLLNEVFPIESTSQQQPLVNYTCNDNDDVSIRSSDKSNDNESTSSVENEVKDLYHDDNHDENTRIDGPYDEFERIQRNISDNDIYAHQAVRDDEENQLDHSLSLNDVRSERGLSMISSTNKLNDFHQRDNCLDSTMSMTSPSHSNIQTASYESNILSALDTYKQMRASMKKSYDTLNISDSSLQTSSSSSSPKMIQPPLISSSEKKESLSPPYNTEGYIPRPNSARRLSQQSILSVVRDSNDRLISPRLDVKADNSTSPRSALSHSGRPPTATTFKDHDNFHSPKIQSISPKYISSPHMRNSIEMERMGTEDPISEHEVYMRASSKPFLRDSMKSLHSIDSTPSISYGDIIPDNDLLYRTTASDINTTYPPQNKKNNQVSYNSQYYATGDDDDDDEDDSKDFEISTSINDSITQQQIPIVNSFHNQMNTQQSLPHQNDSHHTVRNSSSIIEDKEKTVPPVFPPTSTTTTANDKETSQVLYDYSRVSTPYESKTNISPRFDRISMKDNTILNNSEIISHITPIASSTTTTNTTISAADIQDKRTSVSSFISQPKVLDNIIDKNDLLKVKSVLENKQKNELSIKNRHRLKVGHEAYQLLLQEGLLDTTPAAIPIASSNDEHLRNKVVTTLLSDNNKSVLPSRINNITSLEPSRMMPIPKNTTTVSAITTTTNIPSHENPSNSQQSIQQLQSKVLEEYSPRDSIQRLPSRERKNIQDREVVTTQPKSNEHSHTQISGELYTNRNDNLVKAVDTPTNTIINNSINDPHSQIRAVHGNQNNHNNNNDNDNNAIENDDDLISVTSKSTNRRKAEKFDIILSSDQHSTRPSSSRNSSRHHSNYIMKNTNQNNRLPDAMNEDNSINTYDNTVSDNDMKHMDELRQRKIRELERKAQERQKNRRDQSINDYNNSVSSPSQVLSPKSNHNRINSSNNGSGGGGISGKNREYPQVPNRSNGGSNTTTTTHIHIHSPPPPLPGNNSTTYSNNTTAYATHDVRPNSRSSRNNNNSSSSSSRNNRRPDNASPTNNNSYDSKIDYHSYYEDNGLRDTYHQLPQPPPQQRTLNSRQSTDRNVLGYESNIDRTRPRTSADAVVIGNKEVISIQKNSNTNNDNNSSYGQNRQYYESKHNDEYENDTASDKRTSSQNSRSRSHTPSQRGLMNTNSNTGTNLSPRQQDDNQSVTTSERRRPGSTNRTRTPPSTAVMSAPSKLSNIQQIKNALTFVCLAGFHYENDRTQALQILDKIYALSQDPDILDKGGVIITQFIILFYRSKSLSFRGVYGIDYRTQDMLKLFGRGPRILDSNTYNILEYLKYESSTKSFKPLPSKSLTSTTDAISIDPSQIKSKS